ncbi:MAG: site-specific integrase [Candidatus Schekmanbacteria bacterium]|nr:site-specific integrase [Candidatus Schekmanbacteria bacterium]
MLMRLYAISPRLSGRAETTVATYGSALRVFGAFYRESLGKPGPYPSRLAETDVFAFVDHLRRDRLLSAASLNRFVSALRAFARFLLERHWHRRDLGRELLPFRTARPAAPVRLSPEELRHLVTSVAVDGRIGRCDLATGKGSAAQHYLRALYLKGMAHLGHASTLAKNDRGVPAKSRPDGAWQLGGYGREQVGLWWLDP